MKQLIMKSGIGWGLLLWLVGYVLGLVLFFVVPAQYIGWVILPAGSLLTIWVLAKKISSNSFKDFVIIAIIWTVIAVICDYVFLVKLINPPDGYYKPDVYIYYLLTFLLPLMAGIRKNVKGGKS